MLSGLLKWLMKTILVFGLITFSGQVSEFRLHNSEPTKTELNEVKRDCTKRTISFKRIFNGLNLLSYSTNRTENFVSYLFDQDNRITVKLKSSFKEKSNEQDGFLIYHSTKISDELDTNQLRG